MNILKKLSSFAPGICTVLVGALVAVSLSGYTATVYEVEVPKTAEAEESEPEAEKRAVRQTEVTEAETVETLESTAFGSFELADGVYEGTGTGFAGHIRASVLIKDKTIKEINILEVEADDEAFFNRAKGVIDKIILTQSFDVDVVSGATYSSKGIMSAVKNALTGQADNSTPVGENAGQPVNGGSKTVERISDAGRTYKDGVYEGTGTGFGGAMKVRVTISDGKITAINIVNHSDGGEYISRASGLIPKIIALQSTNVDTVSGATYSSVGIIEAVRNALSRASVSGSGGSTEVSNEGQTETQAEDISGRFPYKDGIYYGSDDGFSDIITVGVVIQNQTIKNIVITYSQDDKAFLNRAGKVADDIVSRQTTDVDVVSGATFSSNGIKGAVINALEEAAKVTNGENTTDETALTESETDETETPAVSLVSKEGTEYSSESESTAEETMATVFIDGVYAGTAVCEPDADEDFDSYNLTLNITVRDDKIVAITDITGDGDSSNNAYIRRAANGTSKAAGTVVQITEKGMPDGIDTVSGATCSSDAIVRASLQAIEKARR